MLEMSNPIIVEFPLRGEWLSPNTPGTKVPSHGTNQLGTRYAYDFIQVDWNRIGNPAYRVGLMQYLFSGVKLSDSNFAHRFCLCTLKIQYLAVIQLSKVCCYAA